FLPVEVLPCRDDLVRGRCIHDKGHYHGWCFLSRITVSRTARPVRLRVREILYCMNMVETQTADDHAEGDEPDPAGPAEPVCALEGCDNPLPGPSVDEQGRRKGGRPSSYCCKAHADTASRNRRAAQTASVVDPLVEARRLAEEFTPTAQPLLDMLRHVTERFEGAEQGAIGQVRQAQEDVAAAHAAAEDAQRRAEQAERARDKALATSRDEQQAREEAQRQAKQAADDAERVRQEAWATVAEHERARGAAEAATESANTARDAA